jgi:hypothetical protein
LKGIAGFLIVSLCHYTFGQERLGRRTHIFGVFQHIDNQKFHINMTFDKKSRQGGLP